MVTDLWRMLVKIDTPRLHSSILYGLIFKRHSLGGSSIACLSVGKKCTVASACARRATRWPLLRF